MSRIIIPESREITVEKYWDEVAKKREVKPLMKPCKDCAVVTGFYSEHAKSLSEQPTEVQERVIKTWFCHNNCNRGCKGIIDYLDVLSTVPASSQS